MKVDQLMTKDPRTCTLETNLSRAAALMLDGDCGMLPVVGKNGAIVGVVTDRDLFVALATRDKRASEMTIGEVVQSPVYSCAPDDDVDAALALMKTHMVRRLPVLGFGGTVRGVISMNDIVLAAGAKKPVHGADVVDTMQAICAHHHPVPHVTAA